MAGTRVRTFGNVIRERRRQLDLTQEDVARRINTSVPYIGLLEAASAILPKRSSPRSQTYWDWTCVNCSSWPIQEPGR